VTSRIFAPRARRELCEAAMWVAEDNAAAADALLAAAMVAARRLQARPKLGRVRLDLAPERYRFWSLRGFPYLLVYDAGTDPPIILRFVHQSRDLPRCSIFNPHLRKSDRQPAACHSFCQTTLTTQLVLHRWPASQAGVPRYTAL
jgi:toxin ParE1/3/4